MGSQDLPAPTAPEPEPSAAYARLEKVARPLGLLLVGAGICTLVFSVLAFCEAAKGPQHVITVGSSYFGGAPNVTYVADLRPLVQANVLLAISIGLILGGLCSWLLGWGLANRRRAAP